MKRTLLTIAFLLIVFTTSKAQIKTSTLDTIEVATSRIPLKVSETGRNITILQHEEIQQIPFTSLDDLLQFLPGIEVQSRNAFGAQGDISMRGSTFSQVLLLIDGMRLNDPLTAHFNSYIPVTPAEIERIEVLRGAAAAMYGADAVGGVIHIITKNFDSKKEDDSSVEGKVNYGQHALVSMQQGFSVQKNNLYVGGGFQMNQSTGENIAEVNLEGTTLEAYDNYFDIKTAGLSFGYQFDKGWSVRGRTAFDDRDFSARYFYTSSTFDKSVERAQNWWNQVQVAKVGNRSKTDLNVAYKYNTDEFVFSPDFPSTNYHITELLNFQINHLQIISPKLSFNIGAQFDKRSIESNDRGNHSDVHTGVYGMGVFRPSEQLNLTASLRLDNDKNYGTELSPQLNISYVLPSLVLRGSVGRSIRAADYTERYVSTNLQNLSPGRNLGNPDLMAENGWSQELGLDYSINKNWQIKATGFLRQSSNLIDYISTNESAIPLNENLQEGADYFFASNVTDVTTKGFEVESWLKKSIGGSSRLLWSLGYTYLDTSNEEEVVSVYISSHAGHLLTSNLLFNTPKLQVGLNGLYKVRDERAATSINAELAKSYAVLNLRLGYQLVENFGLNLQIHNLLDEEYQDILGAKMPNRWVMGGIQFGF